MMAGRLDLKVRAAADSGTERDQQLGEDRDRVGFGLGRSVFDDLAEQPVVGGLPGGAGQPAGAGSAPRRSRGCRAAGARA